MIPRKRLHWVPFLSFFRANAAVSRTFHREEVLSFFTSAVLPGTFCSRLEP
jgi:hypothetical protein